jgi:hypothetical protein
MNGKVTKKARGESHTEGPVCGVGEEHCEVTRGRVSRRAPDRGASHQDENEAEMTDQAARTQGPVTHKPSPVTSPLIAK